MGQGQEVTTATGDTPNPHPSKLKRGLKSLGSCEANPTAPQEHGADQGDKPNLFQRAMSGTAGFAKKTKNDVVCGAKDVPHAAAAIKTQGVNRETAGRMANDLLKTSEVMPHHLVLNAAGSVVKSQTGIDLTPGGLKTKVAGAVIDAALAHRGGGSNPSGGIGEHNLNAVPSAAMSAINLLRGRGSALQTVTNVTRVAGGPEVAAASSLTNSVAGSGLARFSGLARAIVPRARVTVGSSTLELEGAPIAARAQLSLGGPPLFAGEREQSLPVVATQPQTLDFQPASTAGNWGPFQTQPTAVISSSPLEKSRVLLNMQSPRPLYTRPALPAEQSPVVVRSTTIARSDMTVASGSGINASASPLASLKMPETTLKQTTAVVSGDTQAAHDPVARAIHAMRLAHQSEASGQTRTAAQPLVAADASAALRAKQIDQDFAAAAARARAAIIAARSSHGSG